MGQFYDACVRPFPISSFTSAAELRVKLSGSSLALAGAADVELGTLEKRCLSGDTAASVRLRTADGTVSMVAAGAISAGGDVFAAASGKVASTGSLLIGKALTAATADGDAIEVLRYGDPTYGVQTLTAAADSGSGSSISAGVTRVNVTGVTTDANDWIVLPPIADVPIGHTIRIMASAGANFEMRTPASSNTKVNDVDCDGSQEYLCTDTDMIVISKRTTTGWVAQSITKLGAVRTAVIPD